jgi:hypothetical protein
MLALVQPRMGLQLSGMCFLNTKGQRSLLKKSLSRQKNKSCFFNKLQKPRKVLASRFRIPIVAAELRWFLMSACPIGTFVAVAYQD